MNKIQVRRSAGTSAPAAGTLENGELAWVDHGTGGANGVLYIGDMSTGTALVKTIGGTGSSAYITDILTDTNLLGNATAITRGSAENSTKLATTEFVQTAVAGGTVAIANASDTNIDPNTVAAGQVLIYDGVNSTWDNKALSGDVTINSDGLTSVISVSQTAVELGVDTFGPYVGTVTNTDNNLAITGVGVESSTAQINLATDVTIAGNLTVVGGTTTVESTVVTIEDPIFTLGENDAFTQDRGIAMKYGSAAKFAFMGMDRTDDKFKYIPDASNTGEVISGSVGKAAFSEINGLLMDATQTNITEIGTITTGAWNADIVAPLYGGLGIDTSTSTGVGSVSGGTWSVTAELATSLGGTGLNAVATSGILLGGGAGNDMTVLALATGASAVGMALKIGASGPEWSNVMDGGTFT